MLLLDVSSFEFIQFLKIVLWVCVPLMILSMLVVTYWHYRNKRKGSLAEDATAGHELVPARALSVDKKKDEPLFKNYRHILNTQEKTIAVNTEIKNSSHLHSSTSNGKKHMDNTSQENQNNISLQEQVKKYELKIAQLNQAIEFMEAGNTTTATNKVVKEKNVEIERLKAVIEQLQKEFYLLDQQKSSNANETQKLEQQVKELQESARHATTESRDVQLGFQQQIENKEKQFFDEKDRLTEQLRSLNEVQKKLEEENKQLLDQIQQKRFTEGTNDQRVEELQKQIAKLEEELRSSGSGSPDVNYLQDMLKERNLQIDFLQNQLDHRIKSFHQLEQQVYDLQHSLNLHREEIKQRLEKEKEFNHLLQQKEENIQQLNSQFGQHTAEREELLKLHSANLDRIKEFEQSEFEWNRQRELLQQEIEQHKNLLDELHPQLERSLEHVRFLETTIERKQSLLSNLHQQLKNAIESEEGNKKFTEALEEYP